MERIIKMCLLQLLPFTLYQPFSFLSVQWGEEIYFCDGTMNFVMTTSWTLGDYIKAGLTLSANECKSLKLMEHSLPLWIFYYFQKHHVIWTVVNFADFSTRKILCKTVLGRRHTRAWGSGKESGYCCASKEKISQSWNYIEVCHIAKKANIKSWNSVRYVQGTL